MKSVQSCQWQLASYRKQVLSSRNASPFAIENPHSLTAKWQLSSEIPSFVIATNKFSYKLTDSHFAPILVKYTSPLRFYLENGHVLFDFFAHDRAGKEIIRIERNEMLLIPNDHDVEIKGSSIIFRESSRKVLLDLSIETAQNIITLGRANFDIDGYTFAITPNTLQVSGKCLRNIGFRGCSFQSMIAVSVQSPNSGMLAALYVP